MEHKIIRTGENTWGKGCVTCGHTFEAGDDRHEWRMNLSSQNKYHAGSFWNTHCHECFVKNIIKWRDELIEEINGLPTCMRELA
jgi:hypothetical protein